MKKLLVLGLVLLFATSALVLAANSGKEHQNNGYEIILISALFPEIIYYLKDYLNIKHIIVPELEVIENKYTGNILNLIPYGINKTLLVKECINKNNFSIDYSYAYSDRFSDLSLFELVKNPIIINPELKLKVEAQKKGWKIFYFNSI